MEIPGVSKTPPKKITKLQMAFLAGVSTESPPTN